MPSPKWTVRVATPASKGYRDTTYDTKREALSAIAKQGKPVLLQKIGPQTYSVEYKT